MIQNDEYVCAISGQTRREEAFNAGTHGLGLAFAIFALVVLVVSASRSGDVGKIVGASIFGASLVMLYGTSTLYHAVRAPRIKKTLQILDHACIYTLIAGTYTPFTLVNLEGGWGWSLFGVVWGFTAVGIVMKFFYAGRYELLSTIVYVGMGWVAIVAVVPIWRNIAGGGIALLLAGGVCYTGGTWFFLRDTKNRYYHAIWHLFVLAGSVCHTFAVLFFVVRPG